MVIFAARQRVEIATTIFGIIKLLFRATVFQLKGDTAAIILDGVKVVQI
jgi:hypothetical protein